jgi:hypothetical protein
MVSNVFAASILGVDLAAASNRARRTASTRIHGCG